MAHFCTVYCLWLWQDTTSVNGNPSCNEGLYHASVVAEQSTSLRPSHYSCGVLASNRQRVIGPMINSDSTVGRASFLTTVMSELWESSATWIAVIPSLSSLGPVFAFRPRFLPLLWKICQSRKGEAGSISLYVPPLYEPEENISQKLILGFP